MNYSNFNLRAKLSAGFGSLLVLMLVASVIAVLNMRRLHVEAERIATSAYPNTQITNQLVRDALQISLHARDGMLEPLASQVEKNIGEIEALRQDALHEIDLLDTLVATDEGKQALARIKQSGGTLEQKFDQLYRAMRADDKSAAFHYLTTEFEPANLAYVNAIRVLQKHQNGKMDEAVASIRQEADDTERNTIIALTVALPLGLGIALLMSGGLVRRVLQVRGIAENIAAGKLNAGTTPDASRDELGQLADAVEKMRAQLEINEAERRKADEQLRIAAIVFQAHEGMVVLDSEYRVLKVNAAYTEITGYTPAEIIGQTPRLFRLNLHDSDFIAGIRTAIERHGRWQGETRDRRKNGEEFSRLVTISAVKDDAGKITHYISTMLDLSESKKASERINELAFFDQLTGLPNRTLLLDRLKRAMIACERNGTYAALLFVDLDNFKTLNDTLGHDMGDMLLQQVGQLMTQSLREGDTVARFGGDEFVLIIEDLGTDEAGAADRVEIIAEKMLAALNQTVVLGELGHRNSASIGITLFHDNQVGIDELMKQADLAMYRSKESGRNALHFFDPEMETAVMKRATMEMALRKAVSERQFVLHYQAQVTGDHITGVEALVRWQHPLHGMLPPAEFIPLAEATGLILPLGDWVLESACAQLAAWSRQADMAHLTIAVNVSAQQFHQSDFVENVLACLQRTGANPLRLKLELTESLLVENIESVVEKMYALKAKGVAFSLDDFGTGYSSLAYLKRLPLDQIKIDQSFVRDVMHNTNDAAIVQTVVALGNSFGVTVIAEGVETEVQREFLANTGCIAYQGYLFSKPVSLLHFEDLMKPIAHSAQAEVS